MTKLEELIAQLCPDEVEYKTVGKIANISRGKVMSKDYLKNNVGEYPVYSSQTENNGQLGVISTYMYDGDYLTWTTDGANAGTVFFRSGKFSITNVCGLIDVKDKKTNVIVRSLVICIQLSLNILKNIICLGLPGHLFLLKMQAQEKMRSL